MSVPPGAADPPVVRGSLLFGSARELRRDQLGTYERAMRAHGDVAGFRIGPLRIGFEFDAVFRPEGARQVLATNVGHDRKEAPVLTEIARFLGDGLPLSEGDRWRRDRRSCNRCSPAGRVVAARRSTPASRCDRSACFPAGSRSSPARRRPDRPRNGRPVGAAASGNGWHTAEKPVRWSL